MSLVFLPLIAGALASANAAAAGSSPPTFSNCSIWLDGTDISKWYTDSQTNGGVAVTSDGQDAKFGIADGSTTRSAYAQGGSGTRPLFKIGLVNGRSGLRFGNAGTNTASSMEGRTSLNPGGTVLPLSTMLGASNFTAVGSVYFRAVSVTTAGASFGWDQVFGDNGGFMGLNCGSLGVSTCRLALYGWDGAEKKATQDINKSQWYVFGMKHDGSNLKLRINAGSWATTACGSISTTTGTMAFDKSYAGAGFGQFDTTGIALYNALLSDSDLLTVERYFGTQVGLSL